MIWDKLMGGEKTLPGAARILSLIKRTVFCIAVALVVVYVALLVFSGPLVDAMYANFNPPADLGVPPNALQISPTSEPNILLGGRGEGLNCSIPWLVAPGFIAPSFPSREKWPFAKISRQFRQACVMHDLCYRYGAATYGYTQLDCDRWLQEDAFRICRSVYQPKNLSHCETFARKVMLGVRLGGAGSFRPDVLLAPIASSDAKTEMFLPPFSHLSTYFEYEAVPRSTNTYVVVRVAPTSRYTNASGEQLQLGLYFFISKPAGTWVKTVPIRRGKDNSAHTDVSEKLLATVVYNKLDSQLYLTHIAAPPLVADERFVQWQRQSFGNTGGRFCLAGDASVLLDCRQIEPYTNLLQVVPDPASPQDRFVGLVSPSGHKDCPEKDCLVVVRNQSSSNFHPIEYQEGENQDTDRYRSHDHAPWVVANKQDGSATLYYARRNDTPEQNYTNQIKLLEIGLDALPKNSREPIMPRVHHYPTLTEDDEPFAIRVSGTPQLISVVKRKLGWFDTFFGDATDAPQPVTVRIHQTGEQEPTGKPKPMESFCMLKDKVPVDSSWIDLPPTLLGSDKSKVVFRRGRVKDGRAGEPVIAFDLALFDLQLSGNFNCQLKQQSTVDVPFDPLETGCRNDSDKDDDTKKRICRFRHAARFALGPSMITDIDKDGRLDFIVANRERDHTGYYSSVGDRSFVKLNVFDDTQHRSP